MGHMERQRLNSNLSRSMYGDRVYFLLAHYKGSIFHQVNEEDDAVEDHCCIMNMRQG